MLTKTPVNAGTPLGCSSASIQNNRVLLQQLLVALGGMLDVASLGSEFSTAELAHWAGATLVRWGEQERAAMGERMKGEDMPED